MDNAKVQLQCRLNLGFNLNYFSFLFHILCIQNYSVSHYIFLFLFYPRINKPDIHNNFIGISHFQNGLQNVSSSTSLHFKSKAREGSHMRKNMFFIHLLMLVLKIYHFCICDIFSLPSGYPINTIFHWQHGFIRFVFLMSIFPLKYQNPYSQLPLRLVTC